MKHGQIQNFNGVNIVNNLTDYGLNIQQDGVLAANKNAIYVYSNAVQTGANSYLVYINQDNASSNTSPLWIKNDGAGNGLAIDQNGAGIALFINQASDLRAIHVISSSLGTVMDIDVTGVMPASVGAVYIHSNAIQTTSGSKLVYLNMEHASSDETVLWIKNDGTGVSLKMEKAGAVGSNNAGVFIGDTGNNAQGRAASVWINTGHVSSIGPCLMLLHNGAGPHLIMEGDPTVVSPQDGAMWYDGTSLFFRDGGTTRTIDWT